MALTYNNQFEAELRKVVEQQRAEVLERLELGGGVPDYPAYREQVGYLRALKNFGDWCEEVRSTLEKR